MRYVVVAGTSGAVSSRWYPGCSLLGLWLWDSAQLLRGSGSLCAGQGGGGRPRLSVFTHRTWIALFVLASPDHRGRPISRLQYDRTHPLDQRQLLRSCRLTCSCQTPGGRG